MNLTFLPQAWVDYLHWQEVDPNVLEHINELLKDTLRHPFTGLGKPEPLRPQFKSFWSRRIDAKHRLVYRLTADTLLVAQLRFHYAWSEGEGLRL